MDWTVESAQENLEYVIDLVMSEGPQYVTQDGVLAVVIISEAEYQQLKGSEDISS